MDRWEKEEEVEEVPLKIPMPVSSSSLRKKVKSGMMKVYTEEECRGPRSLDRNKIESMSIENTRIFQKSRPASCRLSNPGQKNMTTNLQ